ncbi:MAG: hypothetical protein RLY31_1205 [Bacteroidota bacterium]|jgi:hypothetical protein
MKKRLLWLLSVSTCIACAVYAQPSGERFDCATGNAAIEVVIPQVDPVFFEAVTKHGGDPSILIRYTTLIVNGWFDAVAPYHPTAAAVYSRQERQPVYDPSDNTFLNVALTAASKVVLDHCFPDYSDRWSAMLETVKEAAGNKDVSNALTIGEKAGLAVWTSRLRDGMNQDGSEGGRVANQLPFSDYTGYAPVNTPYMVKDPGRWQPAMERVGTGKYSSQVFVTPQYGRVKPYTELWSFDLPLPSPADSDYNNIDAYRKQAEEVLEKSRRLTDEQKMLAEFFENKLFSLPVSTVVAAMQQGLNLMDFVHLFFTQEVAIFDAGIWVWAKKREYDAVRPFTAIAYLYGNAPVDAWAGVGKGSGTLPADNWRSYLPVADHPEYPSASACLCVAHATAIKERTDNPQLGWKVDFKTGSSFVEPGVVPAKDFSFTFETWDQFADICGQTRLWAGVHFAASVENVNRPCTVIGQEAVKYVARLIAGGE